MIEKNGSAYNLGLIYDSTNQLINHRSILKIVLNPILRSIGWQIATPYNKITKILGWMIIEQCPKKKIEFRFFYDLENCKLVKKRRWI